MLLFIETKAMHILIHELNRSQIFELLQLIFSRICCYCEFIVKINISIAIMDDRVEYKIIKKKASYESSWICFSHRLVRSIPFISDHWEIYPDLVDLLSWNVAKQWFEHDENVFDFSRNLFWIYDKHKVISTNDKELFSMVWII